MTVQNRTTIKVELVDERGMVAEVRESELHEQEIAILIYAIEMSKNGRYSNKDSASVHRAQCNGLLKKITGRD